MSRTSSAERRYVRPPLLAPGARVALVAPAGPLAGEKDLARSRENAHSLGWEAVVGANVRRRADYLAGTDAERLVDLNAALADPAIDAVWCVRGGYGVMRLLEGVDYDALRRRPKAVMGYSDVTALLAAVQLRAGVVAYHAPTARSTLTPFARDSFVRAVVTGDDPCGEAAAARVLRPGRAEGRLAGGNLALLAALAGTPFAPDLDGAILVLEDVNEQTYRVDRMLRQLHLAGLLRGARGLVCGTFVDCPQSPAADARALDDLFTELADALDIPCISGAPVGHINDQWTLPLGMPTALDAEARCVRVK